MDEALWRDHLDWTIPNEYERYHKEYTNTNIYNGFISIELSSLLIYKVGLI